MSHPAKDRIKSDIAEIMSENGDWVQTGPRTWERKERKEPGPLPTKESDKAGWIKRLADYLNRFR